MTELPLPPNGWTVYTLKAYMDQRFGDSDRAVAAALQAADKAVNAALLAQKEAVVKAEIATEKRFETVRQEADFRMNALGTKIDDLQAAMNQGAGRRGQEIVGRSNTQWETTTALGVFMFVAIVASGILGALHI